AQGAHVALFADLSLDVEVVALHIAEAAFREALSRGPELYLPPRNGAEELAHFRLGPSAENPKGDELGRGRFRGDGGGLRGRVRRRVRAGKRGIAALAGAALGRGKSRGKTGA